MHYSAIAEYTCILVLNSSNHSVQWSYPNQEKARESLPSSVVQYNFQPLPPLSYG